MTFKEFYLQKYNMKDWGTPGEYMSDVYARVFDTIEDYFNNEFAHEIKAALNNFQNDSYGVEY
jgi:hypothetical protein